MSIFSKKKGLVTALALVAAGPAAAQDMYFKCFFDWVCIPDTGKCETAELDVRYKVNLETQQVSRIGGNALSEYQLILGDRAVTLMEKPISGGVITTTVSSINGDAVHSENAVSGIRLAPVQYLGQCTTS